MKINDQPAGVTGNKTRIEQAKVRTEQALCASELSYRRLFEAAKDGILILDVDTGRISDVNPFLVELLGFSHGEMVGRTVGELSPFKDIESNQAMLERLQQHGYVRYENLPLETRDGRKIAVEFVSNVYQAGDCNVIQCNIRDITGRKAHEKEIERLNRMYLVISRVNLAMVRTKSQAGLFQEICRVMLEFGRFKIAWIGWHAPATQLLAPVAIAGDQHGYVPALGISSDPRAPEGRGPCGTAVREDRICVCNDFFGDPATQPWRGLAARSGIQSCIALPLRREGKPVGLLTVYAAEKDFFGTKEIALLEETAGNVSFVLDVFAGEARRGVAEAALRESEERLRLDTVIETECYRVAQEALTNVVRHAHAKTVTVELRQEAGQLHLRVRDDGIGFDVAAMWKKAVRGASLGLLSMEERAALAGGGLEFTASPKQGTEVHAWFPLKWQITQV